MSTISKNAATYRLGVTFKRIFALADEYFLRMRAAKRPLTELRLHADDYERLDEALREKTGGELTVETAHYNGIPIVAYHGDHETR